MDFPQHCLLECFAGYARAEFGTPVRYPVACHPTLVVRRLVERGLVHRTIAVAPTLSYCVRPAGSCAHVIQADEGARVRAPAASGLA